MKPLSQFDSESFSNLFKVILYLTNTFQIIGKYKADKEDKTEIDFSTMTNGLHSIICQHYEEL